MPEMFKRIVARLAIATMMMFATYILLVPAISETAAFAIAVLVLIVADYITDSITPSLRGEEE